MRRRTAPAPQVLDVPRLNVRGTWADLRDDMLTESRLFFHEIVRDDRSVFDLIDARFTYLNQRLANLYNIGDTNGNPMQSKTKPTNPGEPIPPILIFESNPEGTVVQSHNPFIRVNLENTRRGGLLTQASVLTVTSHPTRTSLVKRGHWVLERILGTPPPPPPPNVPGLEDSKGDQIQSAREQLEQHRRNPNCAGCHARIDPIGFALENFDVLGRYREKDGEQPIDTVGELPDGKQFRGSEELKSILKDEKELFSRNLIEKLLVYATGRRLDYYDLRTVEGILAELRKQDYRFHALLAAIVQSDAFRLRRGKDQAK